MNYIVNVYLGDQLFNSERVYGMAAAEEIQDYYRQWPEYDTDIVPDTREYLRVKHPDLYSKLLNLQEPHLKTLPHIPE